MSSPRKALIVCFILAAIGIVVALTLAQGQDRSRGGKAAQGTGVKNGVMVYVR